jgi:photosynthetic reaction center cytochrome c subunit
MAERSRAYSVCALTLGIVLCLFAAASRAQTQRGGFHSPSFRIQQNPPEQKTAEQVYKNIQVLTGSPASELDGVMSFMSASLGVGCTFCHTNPWDSDVKPAKLAARRMIRMMRAINEEHFSGNPVVNCYTCHRGQPQTTTVPPPDFAALEPSDPQATTFRASASLPPIDQIIDRYTREIGGRAAVDNVKTRVSRGTETTANRMTPPLTLSIEIYQAAENKMLVIRKTPRGAVEEGFNGSAGWIKDEGGQRGMPDKRLAEIRHEADFYRYLKLGQTYPQMRLLGTEKVGERETYVVGATSREDNREKLYFDTRSGLLVRRYVAFKTSFGTIPDVTDFDDYRAVNGARLPFTINWSRPPFASSLKFTEIKVNAPLDDAKFNPVAK